LPFFIKKIANDRLKSFTDRKIPINQAIAVMAKKNIQMNEDGATVILDFLYRIAKTYNFDNIKRVEP